MTERDSFIEEVTEEVRRDRLYRLLRRHGWIAALGLVAIIGGAALNEYLKASGAEEARLTGAALATAAAMPSADARAEAFAGIAAQEIDAGVIARFGEAAALEEAGDLGAAAEVLDQISTDADVAPIYRELAQLKALAYRADLLDPVTRMAELDLLAEQGQFFNLLAVELRALAHLDAGDREAAVADFNAILLDPTATPALQSRAAQLLLALGETPAIATLSGG
ncbi:MAG: hypothetical protein AAGE18_11155 [Pseudomonadota bacterium]